MKSKKYLLFFSQEEHTHTHSHSKTLNIIESDNTHVINDSTGTIITDIRKLLSMILIFVLIFKNKMKIANTVT